MSFGRTHLDEAKKIIDGMDANVIERMAELLARTKESGGRVFFLGVGGSAGNCSHAVNDFRKIVGLEAYAPTDNVSELTARTNDEGWETVFVEWLKVSRLRPNDVIFVFSVGGGNLEKNVSPNLVRALQYAKEIGATILGVVGRDGGYTAKVGDAVCIVPTVNPETITPHSEAFQAVVWHLLVSHPALKARQTKWEGTSLKLLAFTKAVFLDRDGVLNEAIVRDGKPFSPMTVAEVIVPPDVPGGLSRLRQNGFRLIMTTNQPNIARGSQSREAVDAINQYLRAMLHLHAVEVCEHDNADNCDCRKPKPGMLLRAAERDRIALTESFMIGDRWRDIEAGRRAGCQTILIGNGYAEKMQSLPDAAVATLGEAVDWILAQSR